MQRGLDEARLAEAPAESQLSVHVVELGSTKTQQFFSFFATGPRHGFLLRAVAEAVQEGDCRRLDDRHYCKVVFVGTFDILSLVALVLGLRLFNDFSCGTISTRPAAQCES